ncbi:MAG: nickel-responsive transcriptional regulator NikR [Endomicrobiia bacterium]
MSKLVRFGISIDKDLISKFDRLIREQNYKNRSEAIRDLIRENLIKKEWCEGKEVAGAIVVVYDHHKRELVNKLLSVQHDYGNLIVSTQHVHLDHHNCLEVLTIRGKPKEIEKLAYSIKSTKGVKHTQLVATTTGEEIS